MGMFLKMYDGLWVVQPGLRTGTAPPLIYIVKAEHGPIYDVYQSGGGNQPDNPGFKKQTFGIK